ncbi:MAG: hypothetical protein AAF399_22710 [Bacteroidota bacterium]
MSSSPSDIDLLLGKIGSFSINQLLEEFEKLSLSNKMAQQILLGNSKDFQRKTNMGLLTQEQVQSQENQFRVAIYQLLEDELRPTTEEGLASLLDQFGTWMTTQGFSDETAHFQEGDWAYLGFKQGYQPEIVAMVLADQLTKIELLKLRERFEQRLQDILAADRWTFARAPLALLIYWFEAPLSQPISQFISKQSVAKGWLSHTYHLLCWAISEPNQAVIPHKNPIQVVPPIFIAHNPPAGLSPGKDAIEQWLEQPSASS